MKLYHWSWAGSRAYECGFGYSSCSAVSSQSPRSVSNASFERLQRERQSRAFAPGKGGAPREQLLEKPASVDASLLETVLIDEDDLDLALEPGAEVVQVRKAVLGEVVATDDGAVPAPAVKDMLLDPKALAVVLDELAEDGDAVLERNDEGDCVRASAHGVAMCSE
jgi:hypothetical protein